MAAAAIIIAFAFLAQPCVANRGHGALGILAQEDDSLPPPQELVIKSKKSQDTHSDDIKLEATTKAIYSDFAKLKALLRDDEAEATDFANLEVTNLIPDERLDSSGGYGMKDGHDGASSLAEDGHDGASSLAEDGHDAASSLAEDGHDGASSLAEDTTLFSDGAAIKILTDVDVLNVTCKWSKLKQKCQPAADCYLEGSWWTGTCRPKKAEPEVISSTTPRSTPSPPPHSQYNCKWSILTQKCEPASVCVKVGHWSHRWSWEARL